MKNFTLIVPELLSKQTAIPSALKRLLSRADVRPNSTTNFNELMFSLFNLSHQNELPIAAITGLADGLGTQHDYWLRADPVELRADLSAVYLLGNQHLTANNFSIELIQQLKALLALDNLVLHTPHPKHWYIQIKSDPEIITTALDKMLGKNIHGYLTQGNRASYWRKLFTEIQMLLHQQGVQQENVANAVWFWGAGKLPATNKVTWQKIWSDDLLIQGLAKLTHASITKPISFNDCLEHVTAGDYLIVLSQDENIDALQEKWFAPLVKALQSRKITELKLYLGDDKCYTVNTRNIRYFWRRNKIK
jgi:hypothetical protein